MKINRIGYCFTHEKTLRRNRPTGTGDYAILFLRTGAIFKIDNKEITATPHSFILYKKGTPQIFRACEESFVNDWFHFDITE